jgi:hypothetical protein
LWKLMPAPDFARWTQQDINTLISYLVHLGLCDDQNFPILRQNRIGWEVSYSGCEVVAAALSMHDYAEIYALFRETRSFSIKMIDGAILQMMYSFTKRDLQQHRLAFFPSTLLEPYRDAEEDYMNDELFLDVVSRHLVPFPLRFDFDARDGVPRDVAHPTSHMTLGDAKGCRVPVSAPVSPRWFVDFVLRNFYQVEPRDFCSGLPQCNRYGFVDTISPRERQLVHIVIPQPTA